MSKVNLLIDRGFKVSVITQTSRQEGILQGDGLGEAVMHYVPYDAVVHVQDIVLTSGLGGVFPKGLVIGGIKDIQQDRNSLFKKVIVDPAVNFSTLEEVMVLMGEPS